MGQAVQTAQALLMKPFEPALPPSNLSKLSAFRCDDGASAFSVRLMNGSARVFDAEYNEAKSNVSIPGDPDKNKKSLFS